MQSQKNEDCSTVTFADDNELNGLISNDDDSHYKQEINGMMMNTLRVEYKENERNN